MDRFKLKRGTLVEIVPGQKGITIKPFAKKKVSLEELVEKITKDNRHEEIAWGNPRGKEIW